jgi:hypothetical protein
MFTNPRLISNRTVLTLESSIDTSGQAKHSAQGAYGAGPRNGGTSMIRKLVLAALAVTLPVAILTTVGSGVAAAAFPPVMFNGNISCNLSGTMTISPAATNTSTGPYTVSFVGKNNNCIGLYGTSLTVSIASTGQTVTLKKSTDKFSFVVPAGSGAPGGLCNTLLGGGTTPAINPFPINWIGSGGTIVPTTTKFPLGGNVVPGIMTWANGTNLTGSFPGTTDMYLGYNLATAIAGCTGPGITTLAMNDAGGDNLMVGTTF